MSCFFLSALRCLTAVGLQIFAPDGAVALVIQNKPFV